MKPKVAEAPPKKQRHKNPYVGPRAFRGDETLYGRDREKRELCNLLVAERIVLLHAPSGAGKTSLIRAGLRPLLESRRFRPTKPLRVNTEPPEGLAVHNRYVFSAAVGILETEEREKSVDPAELADLDFGAVVERAEAGGKEGFLVLVFDQFEEILTLNPTDWEHQAVFFRELGRMLVERPVWALFSMREDYIGGLERYLRHLPGHLATTYRLDFLNPSAAKDAIRLPAEANEVTFTADAAEKLVGSLAVQRIQSPGGKFREVEAPYVQPLQLQVVCRKLWKAVAKEKGANFHSIDDDDVDEYADIPGALRSYYAGAVADVVTETGAAETAIRNWFDTELITAEGFRSQTLVGPDSEGVDPARVLRALEDQYLIRSDPRAGAVWWELTHDVMIEPIIEDNNELREPWQIAARRWNRDHRRDRLLSRAELRDARKQSDKIELAKVEEEFLEESAHAEKKRSGQALLAAIVSLVGTLAFLEFIVIVVLGVMLYRRW